MFAALVARRGGMTRLVITYFVLAAMALVIAVTTFAVGVQHNNALGQETLQLNITRYHG
jgi:hypothetical protein